MIVWYASLDEEALPDDRLWQSLSADEWQRARQIHHGPTRASWMRSRWFLRTVLAAELGVQSTALVFALGAHGKPRLVEPASRLHFNLSHSGNWVALAISNDGEVGVDIEAYNDEPIAPELVAEVLTAPEQQAFNRLPPDQQPSLFYALWTAKEALMKATGQGINLRPQTISVALGTDHRPQAFLSHPGAWLQSWNLNPRLRHPDAVGTTMSPCTQGDPPNAVSSYHDPQRQLPRYIVGQAARLSQERPARAALRSAPGNESPMGCSLSGESPSRTGGSPVLQASAGTTTDHKEAIKLPVLGDPPSVRAACPAQPDSWGADFCHRASGCLRLALAVAGQGIATEVSVRPWSESG